MKKTIVFDFDGVIHTKYYGYRDGSIYGDIDFELLCFIEQLLKEYYVIISSNRDALQIVNYMNKLNFNGLKFEVFNKTKENPFWCKSGVIGVTNEKAVGILYVDDRGFKYDVNKSTLNNIKEINKILKGEKTDE